MPRAALLKRAGKVTLVAFDVDGVLTDGKVSFSSSGEELKSFDIKDGHAIKLALRNGLAVAFITGRKSPVVERRAEELGVPYLYQGAKDKAAVLSNLLEDAEVSAAQVAFLGDDLVDLPVITRVGLGCAVADAVPEVRAAAALVTASPGGQGAARELIIFILKSKGLWGVILKGYMKK